MSSSYVRQWQLLAALWLFFGAALVWNLYDDYNAIDFNERERLTTLSRVIDENLQVQLHATHDALNSIRGDLSFLKAQKDGKSLLNLRLKAMTDAMVGVRTLLILDAKGMALASSRAELIGKDFHDREYFRATRQSRNPAMLYVSPPFKTSLGVFTLALVKIIPGDRGELAGAIVATLDPEYFNTMLNSVLYTPDMRASILDSDGRIFVTSPKTGSENVNVAMPDSIFMRHRESGQIATVLTGHFYLSGEQRMMATYTTHLAIPPMDKLLVTSVGRDMASVFAAWRRSAYGQGMVLALLILFTSIGLAFYQRRQRVYNALIGEQVAERKRSEEKINELAFFDQMTGLPNRTLLLDRLKQALAASSRSGSYGALLLIDLDNFKTLNDTHGHDTGDMLLKQVAHGLTKSVREGDTVARFGGDEFVMILAGLVTKEREAATSVEAVAEKILTSLNQTYQLGDIVFRSTASIGIALFKGVLTTADDLMKQADLAMYKSKSAGRNALRFFDPEMETAVIERAAREADLREAVRENQLLVHYQAQVIDEGRLTGAEVLVRWQHSQRGLVPPDEFIPLAEETGLILALGHWVLNTACVQLALWATRPDMAHLTVAVNVSAQEFRAPDFVEKVVAILIQTGANPNRLKLELTESMLVDNVEDIISKMFALKSRGVGFSLDDFGTGYSSLSYLKRLPLDQLKIDQSFVRDVLNDPNDAAIAKTIVALAGSLGLGVIAEGVETEAQRSFLASSGCHVYQGYLFSRPLPLASFEEFARRI